LELGHSSVDKPHASASVRSGNTGMSGLLISGKDLAEGGGAWTGVDVWYQRKEWVTGCIA